MYINIFISDWVFKQKNIYSIICKNSSVQNHPASWNFPFQHFVTPSCRMSKVLSTILKGPSPLPSQLFKLLLAKLCIQVELFYQDFQF